VSVQLTDQQSRPIVPERHHARRDAADTSCSKSVLEGWQIIDLEREPRCRNVLLAGAAGPPRGGREIDDEAGFPPQDEVLSPRRPRPGRHQAVPAPGRD
jgi:hypothetical protein